MLQPIIFTGSSIMALWESLPTFFPHQTILNTAISGSHTHEILAQWEELTLRYAPQAVCYYCGSNDINYDTPPSQIIDNTMQSYHLLHQRYPQAHFIYLSIIKAPQKRDKWHIVTQVNEQLRQQSLELPQFYFIDINPVFFEVGGQPRMACYLLDQLHLTAKGYTFLGEYLAPQVLALLS